MRPLRGLARRLRNWNDRRQPVILLYHRVSRLDRDPWNLAVTPDLFLSQMTVLTHRRKVVPLERLVHEMDNGRVPADWVAITFDDGYADVLHEAYPILQQTDCPATLFMTTGALDSNGFWWDRLARVILSPTMLPDRLTIEGDDHSFIWDSRTHGADRQKLHLSLWRRLRLLGSERRERELERIEAWAGRPDHREERDRALTTEELRQLAGSGIFSIGAHTISHAPLPQLTPVEKAAEISGSRQRCEEILGRPVETFAYPFGEMDSECQDAVRRAGFRFACSTVPGPVRRSSPRFALPRLGVGSWSGEELLRRLPWGG